MKNEVEKCLTALNMKKDTDFVAIGLDAPGKRSIEGLLPDVVRTAVFTASPNLVMAATSGNKEEREQAKNQLKRKYLDEFKSTSKPGPEYFSEFYKIVKIANRSLCTVGV